ncbi:MAG: hypothetical protein ACUZ8O_01595 [Candidatus Anammoxibacter sp.]
MTNLNKKRLTAFIVLTGITLLLTKASLALDDIPKIPNLQEKRVAVITDSFSCKKVARSILRYNNQNEYGLKKSDTILAVVRSSSTNPLNNHYDSIKDLKKDIAGFPNILGSIGHIYVYRIINEQGVDKEFSSGFKWRSMSKFNWNQNDASFTQFSETVNYKKPAARNIQLENTFSEKPDNAIILNELTKERIRKEHKRGSLVTLKYANYVPLYASDNIYLNGLKREVFRVPSGSSAKIIDCVFSSPETYNPNLYLVKVTHEGNECIGWVTAYVVF